MQTTVKLQDLFTYSAIPMVIVGIIVLAITIYLLSKRKKKEKVVNNNMNVNIAPQPIIKNIPLIKDKYLQQLNNIEMDYKENRIDLRIAYQFISETIRFFVFEVTDIKAQNFSLREIKKLNIPQLYELIAEYYEPEFASKTVGDFDSAINKARRVISEWR